MAESFFSTLEHELGGEAKWATRMEAIRAVSEYIDGFYNPTRRHSTLDGLSPIEFERRFRERGDQETGGFAPACKSFSGEERLQESPEAAA